MGKRHAKRIVFSARLWPLLLALGLGLACEGAGRERPGQIVQKANHPGCTPVGGAYPSGFDALPSDASFGVLMQYNPKALLAFDLRTSPPTLLTQSASPPFPTDSDGDGVADISAFQNAGLCPDFNPACIADPKPGQARAVRDDLVLVTTSDYEQLLFIEPETGQLVALPVTNPSDIESHRASDWPLLPPAGTTQLRTALSTQTCVYPDPAVDSRGNPIPTEPGCDPERAAFRTRFTAATAKSGDLLFVATSNVASSSQSRFNPGSVLVYDFKNEPDTVLISPHTTKPFIQTLDFNPTALTNHTTQSGRLLILVTNTGILSDFGEKIGDSGIDVLDVATLKIVARYPLGQAAARGGVSLDPSGRVGLIGAESERALYGIDLAALEDPALYDRTGLPPVDLDGHEPGFPDARIFWAEQPLSWPARGDGPGEACTTRTAVSFSHSREIAYATDWCDGNLIVFSIDLWPPPSGLFDSSRFRVLDRLDIAAPKTNELFGLAAAPSFIRNYDAIPTEASNQTNVAFILNEPEGQLCNIRLEY